jgi:small subunit ribosomal protein S13
MARISGVDLPREKRVEHALPYIFGVGLARSQEILSETGVDPNTRVKDLTEADAQRIREYIDKNFKVEGDLRRDIQLSIKRLMDIGSYRGLRHRRSLPVRGQRSRTNSRTRKGPRRTVAGKKKAPKK